MFARVVDTVPDKCHAPWWCRFVSRNNFYAARTTIAWINSVCETTILHFKFPVSNSRNGTFQMSNFSQNPIQNDKKKVSLKKTKWKWENLWNILFKVLNFNFRWIKLFVMKFSDSSSASNGIGVREAQQLGIHESTSA